MNQKTERTVKNSKVSVFYRCVLFFMIFTVIPFYGQAQESPQPRFEIETDPLAYLFRGYSVHAAVTYTGFRTSIGTYGIKPPDFLKNNYAFSVFTSGFDIKTDYLF